MGLSELAFQAFSPGPSLIRPPTVHYSPLARPHATLSPSRPETLRGDLRTALIFCSWRLQPPSSAVCVAVDR